MNDTDNPGNQVGDVVGTTRPADDPLRNVAGNAPWNTADEAAADLEAGPVNIDVDNLDTPGTVTIDEIFAGTSGPEGVKER